MMNTFETWLSLEEFEKIYYAAFSDSASQVKALKYGLKEVVKELHSKHPSPESYLEAISNNPYDTICKGTVSGYNHLNEINYILPWLYLHRVTADRDEGSLKRRNILIEHLKSKMPRLHYVWLYYFGLLTQEESNYFWKNSRSSGLTLHVLLAAKPIRQFTEEDVKETSLYNVSSCYNPKIVGEYLYRNGYTKKLYSNAKSGKEIVLAELSSHPVVGNIIIDYYQYMSAQAYSRRTITGALRAIKYLMAYMKHEGLSSCSKFSDFDLKKLTNFISQNGIFKKELAEGTVAGNLYEIDLFFQWGIGRYSFFPEVYNSPIEELGRLAYASKKKYWASDGLAFNSEETAGQLARAIVAYRPENEIEKLCRYYWMICMSTIQRISWFLQLEAGNCLAPMPLSPKAVGLYSKYTDKGGHIYGQFPILHKMGIKAVKELEIRATKLNLQPIPNPENGLTYIHLFQLTDWPWILGQNRINAFLKKIKELNDIKDVDGSLAKGSSHSFRTHLLGEVLVRTGRTDAAIMAAGHRNNKQIRAYLKSNLAQRCLARAFIGKFESGEITGPFFIRIMEILTNENTPSEEMYQVLTTEMPLNEYMKKYGVKSKYGVGTCMNQFGCPHGNCWECPYFIMAKDEVNQAIRLLALHLVDIRRLNNRVKDFSSTALAQIQLKTIVLITKHLLKLGATQEILDIEISKLLSEENINAERD